MAIANVSFYRGRISRNEGESYELRDLHADDRHVGILTGPIFNGSVRNEFRLHAGITRKVRLFILLVLRRTARRVLAIIF